MLVEKYLNWQSIYQSLSVINFVICTLIIRKFLEIIEKPLAYN